MKIKLLIKAVTFVAALSLFCNFSGCKKEMEYAAGDIVSVSTSCGHMDYSHSYSFYIVKKGDKWLFSADCSENTRSDRIQLEDCPVTNKEAKKLISLVEVQKETETLKSYKEQKLRAFVLDETQYFSVICFSNGETLSAKRKMSDETVEFFCYLSKKYKNN